MVKQHKFPTVASRNSYIVARKKDKVNTQELAEEVDLSPSQVNRIYKRYKQNGQVSRKKGSGRRKVLTKAQKLQLLRAAGRRPGALVQSIIDEFNIPCSDETAITYLKSMGYSYKKTQKRPYLDYVDEQARLYWTQSYREYPFTTTVFVDESVFQVGRPYYSWGKKGDPIPLETRSFPPTVSVWGSISMLGKVSLTFYEGTLDAYDYQTLLRNHLYRQANQLWGEGVWIMLQDGATCHTAGSTIRAISNHAGDIIDWPAASPDLNPMENVWSILKDRVAKRNPQTKEDLKNFIRQEWRNLDNDEVITIAESMPDRVLMLIENKGSYTGY